MKTRLALLALLLPLPLLADPAEPTTGAFWRDVVVNGDKKIKSFRIPGIAITPKNTLIAVYDHRYNNSGDLPGNVDVGMARSTDGGKTWSKTKPIIDFDASVKGSNGNGVGDPCVLVDKKTGTIWVAALWSFGNRAWGGSGPGMTKEETGQFVLVKSENDGVSWSRPINITKQVKDPEWRLCFQGPGSGICTSKGILVFPAQYRDKSGTEHSFFIYSKDGGKTWKPAPPAAPGKRTTEAQVCETPDGSLLISMRNHNSGNRAWAVFRAPGGDLDKGKWEEVYFDIPDPVCAAGLASNPRNLKQVVFTNPAGPGRSNLTVYLSEDGGKTFPHSRLLQPGTAMYSAATFLPDGSIGIIYEAGNAGGPKDAMRYARVTTAWIKADKNENKDKDE